MSTRIARRPSARQRIGIPDLEVADISPFHRSLVRIAIATAFLSGIDLVFPIRPAQPTHIILGLAFILILLANMKLPPVGAVGLVLGLLGASSASILLTAPTFGHVADRLSATTFAVLLAGFMLAAYYSAFLLVGRNVQAFFREYLGVALFFAAIGLVQQAVFVATHIDIFGFLPRGAKDYGAFLGISGLSVEPAFYACALLPAGAYYVVRFVSAFQATWPAVIVVGAILFSTSVVGYIGLFTAAAVTMIAGIPVRRAWLLVPVLPIGILASIWALQLEFVQLRLQDSLALLDLGVSGVAGTNLSSYSLAVNASITVDSLRDNMGLGAGFGLYSTVFDRYIVNYATPAYIDQLPGRGSATSFFLRITAELGILGLGIVAAIVVMFLLGIARGSNRQIAIAGLAVFAAILLRMGEYFDNGVLFVVLLGFVIWREGRPRTSGPLRGNLRDRYGRMGERLGSTGR